MDFKKIENKSEFLKFKNFVISNLRKHIDNEINNDYKKATLLTYWLNDYRKYLIKEKTFKPMYLPVYQRGTIISVNLGFNIGSEHGGLHYAVVLNRKDTKYNTTLTVIPLSSLKDTKKENDLGIYEVPLGDELHKLLLKKAKTIINSQEKRLAELITSGFDNKNPQDIATADLIKNGIEEAKKYIEKIDKLKSGSYALTNQLTTISKIRIQDPLSPDGILYNIQLSDEHMEKISNNIKKFIDL